MKSTRYCPTCLEEVPVNLLRSRGDCVTCGTVIDLPVKPESNAMNPYVFWWSLAAIAGAIVVVGWWAA